MRQGGKESGGGGKKGAAAAAPGVHPDAKLLDAMAAVTVAGLAAVTDKERDDALAKVRQATEIGRPAACFVRIRVCDPAPASSVSW